MYLMPQTNGLTGRVSECQMRHFASVQSVQQECIISDEVQRVGNSVIEVLRYNTMHIGSNL